MWPENSIVHKEITPYLRALYILITAYLAQLFLVKRNCTLIPRQKEKTVTLMRTGRIYGKRVVDLLLFMHVWQKQEYFSY